MLTRQAISRALQLASKMTLEQQRQLADKIEESEKNLSYPIIDTDIDRMVDEIIFKK